MQIRRSAVNVLGNPEPRFIRALRDAPHGVAWLALTLYATLLPVAGQAQTVEWARSVGEIADDHGLDIATDAAGNSYVTGSFQGTATFGSATPIGSAGARDIFVAKFIAPPPIPAVSQWGLVVMGLLVLAAGTAALRRRVSTTASA